ncbi:50S ribosomal protein L11 [Candidatus Woesearchaeota archaeon]|nr:50S ribosomal protein L11 [Candidatus Woesearchaeota archaeon]
MPKQTIEAMVEGGKATAAPPLGPALGPAGVNIGQVIVEINKKTADFKGMQVPIKIQVADDKSFSVTVGTPPVSALIKKEAGLEKGSGNPLADKVADLKIEQIIKIAKMKADSLLGKDMFARVKEVVGSCNSMGVMVEGKPAKDVIKDINSGSFKDEIIHEKTELSAEELQSLEEERKRLAAEVEKRKVELTTMAKSIIEGMAGKPRGMIKAKLVEAKIPALIIEELLPVEGAGAAAPGAAPGAAPAAGAKPEAKPAAKK